MRYRSPARSVGERPRVRQIIGRGLCVSLLLIHALHASSDEVTPRRSLDSGQRCAHVASSGDSIDRIAMSYRTPPRALLTTNRLVSAKEVPCRGG